MTEELGQIVQLEECGLRRANQLLGLGYQLLNVAQVAKETPRRKPPPDAPAEGSTYIRRDLRYVIGRTAEQDTFPPYEPRETA